MKFYEVRSILKDVMVVWIVKLENSILDNL